MLKLLCQTWRVSAESLSITGGSRLPNWRRTLPSLPLSYLPFPFPSSSSFPLPPLRSSPLKYRGLRRAVSSPSGNRIWCILALKSDIWWTDFTNFPKLNTGSLPGLLDYVVDLIFNVPGLDIDVQGLTSEVPALRPGQTRPNLSPAHAMVGLSYELRLFSIFV